MLSHSIVWHFLHVVYNILNMQRYATSVAGHTCSYSRGLIHAGSMRPARAFCAARDAFREFSNN